VNGHPSHLVRVRSEPDGRFTAEAVGLSEVKVTAERREVAIQHVEAILNDMLARGELVAVSVPLANPLRNLPKIDPNDPDEQEFLRFLEKRRQEDLEERLRELDAECSDTSSTPTT
jgi:hypothetical protein